MGLKFILVSLVVNTNVDIGYYYTQLWLHLAARSTKGRLLGKYLKTFGINFVVEPIKFSREDLEYSSYEILISR